jgi:hypothetical protein
MAEAYKPKNFPSFFIIYSIICMKFLEYNFYSMYTHIHIVPKTQLGGLRDEYHGTN